MSRRRRSRQADGTSLAGRIGRRRLVVALIAAPLVLIALAAGVLYAAFGDGSSEARTAVIVDQLSLTVPNKDFSTAVTRTLRSAGYDVDYVPGDEVNVDFYRDLPSRGYDIIIMRVHAGITQEVDDVAGSVTRTEYVSLFTGEPYSEERYVQEQNEGQLGKAEYYEGADPLFGISPRFITSAMRGNFDGALVVMMGCDGLRSTHTAEAFIERGVKTFVSWSRPVTAPHTDAATQRLLQELLVKGLSVEDAVKETMATVGPDPQEGAELRFVTDEG